MNLFLAYLAFQTDSWELETFCAFNAIYSDCFRHFYVQSDKKKNEKDMQNISRHKLKHLVLEYSRNFFKYCIAFKRIIFSFCMLSSFLKKLSVGWCQTFIHVYVDASCFIITASFCVYLKMSWSQLFYLFPLILSLFLLNKMIIGAVVLVEVLCARSIWFLLKFVISPSSPSLDINWMQFSSLWYISQSSIVI